MCQWSQLPGGLPNASGRLCRHAGRQRGWSALVWTLLFLCAATAAEAPGVGSTPASPKRRLLVNNDGTNLLWRNDLTPEMVRRHVAECPNAVTTYLLCPNGIQKMLFPSAHEELATRGGLPKLVAEGHDPFGEFLAGLKTRGIETFITWRMNEVHNVNQPTEPDLSRFWREHPDYRVERGANTDNWMAQCLDYSLAPVREYNLALIFELMEKYEPDGIELDWMRFPRHLSGAGDKIWDQRHHLSEVVARVKAKADELARCLRRPMLVSVRVPTSPAGCRALGVDIGDWNRRRLIDFVTASPFLASDFAMPLAEMRRTLGDRPVPLYAAIEFGYAGRSHREETIRAAALGLWDSGADGIYLFNFPCWREQQPHPFWSWVSQLGDPESMRGRDLVFPLINQHHRVGGVDLPSPLPVTIPVGETRSLTLRLPHAAMAPDQAPISARLTLEGATNAAARINDVAVGTDGTVPANRLRAGENQLALSNGAAAPVTVTLAELELDYTLAPPLALPRPVRAFHVATQGSDRNPGTAAKPFRTLGKARDAVRHARGHGSPSGVPMAIILRDGTHRLEEPLVLDARDNDTIFRAFPGETPVISGGRAVAGWKADANGRWKTTVSLGDFRQLYVNGRRAVRARGECSGEIVRYGAPDLIDADAGFLLPDGAMAEWRNVGEMELGFFNSWSHMICRIEQITRDAQGRAVVKMRQPGFFLASHKEGVQAKLPAYIENALELLDTPGEWYYDRPAHTLYYRPREGEEMTRAVVVASQLESLVRLEGTLDRPVRGVVFAGVTFAEATWLGPSRNGHVDVQANFTTDAANLFTRDGWVVKQHNEYVKSPANVVLRAAEGCRFDRCTFTRLGAAGLDIEHGSRGNRVNGCHFFDISGSAIQIGDVQAADHHPDDLRLVVRGNRVTNCQIHDVGNEYEDSVGVFAGYTDGTVIAHNEINDLPYSAISVGWGWGEEDAGGGAYAVIPFRYATPTPGGANRIERNHISHAMRRRDDGGAIYLLGNEPGTVIRENYLHDCGPGNPGGIYLDEGSGFIEITRNRVHGVATPMNYNNRAQDRIATCFEHDNFFEDLTGASEPSDSIVRKAGPEPAYREADGGH